jgi:hypothetical protein
MPAKGQKLSQEAKAKISAARSKPQAKCVCLNCGSSFETHQSEVRRGGGKFCCKTCEGKYKSGTPRTLEVRNKISIANKGRIFTKEWKAKISKSLTGKHGARNGAHHTESAKQKLRDVRIGMKASKETKEKMSACRRGKDNPAWQGGVSFGKYCPKFNDEFKERVRAFFDYKCLECGNPQNGERLTVHHIQYNKQTCCDGSLPMFAPLCRNCHAKTNFNRDTWEQKYADIIQNYYSGKSFFTKEEYAAYKNGN